MLRKLFALTEQGAKDLKKGIIASVFTSLSLMMPMGLLLMLVMQLLQPLLGMETATPSLGAYAGMCLVLLVIIFLTHYIQYRCTYIAAYAESAQRRIGLAVKLRTLPLSFFGKRDLSDLTTTMMLSLIHICWLARRRHPIPCRGRAPLKSEKAISFS